MTEVAGASDCPPVSSPSSRLPLRLICAWGALTSVAGCHREAAKAPLHFSVALETEGCAEDLREIVVQLDQHAPASGVAYRFGVDPSQRTVDGTIQNLPEGTYHATITGRTVDGRNTCSRGATVLVSSRGTGRAALKLTCESACTSVAPEIQAVACPSLDPRVPATLQFTSVPFRVEANQAQAAGSAVWSSKDLSFATQGEVVRARCAQATRRATATVTASNAACAVHESVNVKCVDAQVIPFGNDNLMASGWPGALPGRTMPITRAVYRASCDEVVKQQLGSAQTCTSVGPRFCSCAWTGNTGAIASGTPQSVDGPVLGGAADETVSEEQLEQLRNQLAEIGRGYLGVPPSAGETPVQAQKQAAGAVRVAVIDTTGVAPYDISTGLATEPADNNLHGRAVALVIADTACSTYGNMGECPVKVHSYLALNALASHNGETTTLGIDNVHGGYAGTLTDLSLAIRRAVDDWKPNAANERLIINISAGWDPIWGGAATPNGAVTGTPELVLESVQYAHCAGAVVFAAAGNRTTPFGSAAPETAIYPAAWTTLPAPTPDQCAALGVADAKPDAAAPLLHAVGGLDLLGGPLMTGRPNALPPLATVGINVVRHEPYGAPHHTPTLTGTSMSTAAVSGVAAHYWMQNPTWTPTYLTEQLYQKGQPTTHTANICAGAGPCREVRNVVLCATQGDVTPIGCSAKPPTLELPASSPPEIEEPIPLELVAAESLTPGTGEQPWVYPQPPDDPSCGVCQFQNPDNKLDINWLSSFDPSRVVQMRIYLNDNSGYWTIPQSIATTRQSFRVTLNGASDGTTAGTVRYRYNVGASVVTIEESLVVP